MTTKKSSHESSGSASYAFKVFWGTFFCACILAIISQLILAGMKVALVGFVLLLVIIAISIVFDIVGVAVMVANPVPFHAKAARKLPGAKKTLGLLNKSSQVANICTDVIGDICGILSGGIGTALLVAMVLTNGTKGFIASVIMTGMISALTVVGKAVAKSFAINQADQVMWRVGQILDWQAMLTIRKDKRELEKEENIEDQND